MSRKRCHRRTVTPLPPRGLRPTLDAGQRFSLGLYHNVNLDALARGQGDTQILWDWVGSVLTWSRVAELLGTDIEAMTQHLASATALVERYRDTGRVIFTGLELQAARRAVRLMDELAACTDRHTAVMAAEWSEAKLQGMASVGSAERAAA